MGNVIGGKLASRLHKLAVWVVGSSVVRFVLVKGASGFSNGRGDGSGAKNVYANIFRPGIAMKFFKSLESDTFFVVSDLRTDIG